MALKNISIGYQQGHPKTINLNTIYIKILVFEKIDDNLRSFIQPYLPPAKTKTGRPRSNLRKIFNGAMFALKMVVPWRIVYVNE